MRRIALLMTFAWATVAAQNLAWVNPQAIVLDQNGSGTVTMVLQNKTAAAIPLAPVIDQFTHAIDGKTYTLKTTWAAVPPLAAASNVPANGTFPLTITVSGVTAAGVSTTKLWNNGQSVADLKAIRVPSTYNVQMVSPTPDKPEIHLVGRDALFTLKNSDASEYKFHWKLRYDGAIYDGEPFVLPANGTYDLRLPAPQAGGKVSGPGASPLWAGTLKDEIGQGSVILTPDFGPDVPQPLAAKEIPVGLRFSYWTSNWQQLWNGVFTFLLLAVGGIASIIVNAGIPNTKGALALRRELRALEEKVHGLDSSIDSQWRALLEATLTGLCQQLNTRAWVWIFPSFTTTLKNLSDQWTMVQQWVEIAYETSIVSHAVDESASTIPPTVRRQIQESCYKALSPMESGFTKDAELTTMQASLAAARHLVDLTLSGSANSDLVDEIKARQERVNLDDLLTRQEAAFGGLIARAKAVTSKDPTPDTYVERDIISWKLDLLRQYDERVQESPVAAAAAAGGAANPVESAGTRLRAQGQRLAEYLIPDSYESLRIAALIVDEMKDDIYTDGALQSALSQQPACDGPCLRIEHEPAELKENQPVRLGLVFARQILNEAAARQEWTCRWNFGRDSREETGWEVWHVFPAGPQTITVTIVDLAGACVPHPPEPTTVTVAQAEPMTKLFGPENLLEAGRVFVVLAIALLGIMTAAQQKVQSLTFFEAVGAVVGLGFGADTVKNLILRSSSD